MKPIALLFASGAGAPSSSGWMVAWKQRLSTFSTVTTFDYPYMRAGRKAPDKLPVLIAAHRQALAEVEERAGVAAAVFLIGKSMGGRVGCHLALEAKVAGVVCMGYPLVGTSGAVRDEVLLALRTPILFVQGSRDPLCPLDRLESVRARMTAPNALVVVDGGNHSLELAGGKKMAAAQEQSTKKVLDAIHAFVASRAA